MHDQVKPAGPAYTAGLVRFLLAGLFLLGVYLFGRVQDVFPGAEMHRAVLRLRGTLVLLGITWYGRHILLPSARWRNLWWLFLPGLAVIVVGGWPLLDLPRLCAALRGSVLLGIYLGLAEVFFAALRGAGEGDLNSIPARQAAALTVKQDAARLCFLIALATGASLFLLSVDYIFDFLVYSLLGTVVVLFFFIAPPAILAARLEKSITRQLLVIGGWEEAAFAAAVPPAGEEIERIRWLRQVLLRSARPHFTCWDWSYPAVSAMLLLLLALLYQ